VQLALKLWTGHPTELPKGFAALGLVCPVPPDEAARRARSGRHGLCEDATVRPAGPRRIAPLSRYICTPRVARHRLFVWATAPTLPDSRVCVIAREDAHFFGVLHSRVHEAWALATSPRHGVGNDPTYNDRNCFETFPLPWPPGNEPPDDPRAQAIAEAARELVAQRDAWLNPPGATQAELKGRTLTNMYNRRPTWLDLAHRRLDEAVLDAYGWPHDLADEAILERLLELNLARTPA
jgi:type II restriction/modification system DNA methylase subunit YeeA